MDRSPNASATTPAARILFLGGTRRAIRCLRELRDLLPHAQLTVVSYRERSGEPTFFDDIRSLAVDVGAKFTSAVMRVSPSESGDTGTHDLLLAVNWRTRVPSTIYRAARLGAFVFHDSLLPRYRGFSPTVWAMINGEDHTGVTLFEMTDEIDGGDIVDQERVAIMPEDTIAEVTARVTEAYVSVLRRSVPLLISGSAPRSRQDPALATYGCRRAPEDDRIDWKRPTQKTYDLIRAVARPYWGAYTSLAGRRLTIWSATMPELIRPYVGRIPGRVVERRADGTVVVLTGDGTLMLREVQLEDDQPRAAASVITGQHQTVGR